MDWAESLRREFTLSPNHLFLNSGSLSRCPTVVVDQVVKELRLAEENPTEHLFGAWERIWESQKSLAEFLGARAEDIFLRPNVSMALNEIILGVPLAAGGEILISDLEYGAMENVCRARAERSGMKLRKFRLLDGADVTHEQVMKSVTSALTNDTRLLMVSHVITGTGLILPIAEIAKICRDRGIVLVVDGAHGPGALPLDFNQLDDLDFYGANVHKWMMGPKGTGFGWVHPRYHNRFHALHVGWTTYETPAPFSKFAPESSFAQRLVTSSVLNFSPIFALPQIVAWWQKWGEEKIRARIYELQSYALHQLRSSGWKILTPLDPKLRGPLLSIEVPEEWTKLGWTLMEKVNRSTGATLATPFIRGRPCLRLTPHVYNSEQEIDLLIERLNTAVCDGLKD